MIKDIGNGTIDAVTIGSDEETTGGRVRGAAIGWGTIGLIVGSMWARSRAEKGLEPFAGFIA